MFNSLKFYTLLLITFCYGADIKAQSWSWVNGYGGAGADRGRAITGDGNKLFVAGSFSDKLTIDGIEISSQGGTDLFLSRHDSDGKAEWVSVANSELNNRANAIVLDEFSGLFLGGYFSGNLQVGNQQHGGNIQRDGFVSRWSQNGGIVWFRKISGTGQNEVLDLTKNSQNEVFATGYFHQTASFENNQITAAGASDVFVAKYSFTGNLEWVNHFGGTNSDRGNAIAVDDSGKIYFAGSHTGDIHFGSNLLEANQFRQGFVVKLDPSGNVVWAKPIESSGLSEVTAMDYLDGKIFVTGIFTESFTFGQQTYQSQGGKDVFVMCYDTAGNQIWANAFHASQDVFVHAIEVNANRLYVVGDFKTSITTDDGLSMLANQQFSTFTAELSTNGQTLNLFRAGGSGEKSVSGIYILNEKQFYTTGYFTQSAVFGGQQVQSGGGQDIFLGKFDKDLLSSIEENEKDRENFSFESVDHHSYKLSQLYPASYNHLTAAVFDMNGRQVFQKGFVGELQFSLSGQASGMYVIVLTDGNKTFFQKQFLHFVH